MANVLRRRFRFVGIALVLVTLTASRARADEIWVAPTVQADAGGLGVASNTFWPVTPAGVVRLAWAIPHNLRAFQSAKLALIPATSFPLGTLTFYVCPAQSGQVVTANCSGPFRQSFRSTANQLLEIDMSEVIGTHLGTPGTAYVSVLAYTMPTTATDHIIGLRFTYTAGPSGPCWANNVRYADCGNGTVTDQVTGLIWLKQSDCLSGGDFKMANEAAQTLESGDCGLSDNSAAGQWRLPTKAEWEATLLMPPAPCPFRALTNNAGTACWGTGESSFHAVTVDYWSSSAKYSVELPPEDRMQFAWKANLFGVLEPVGLKPVLATSTVSIWPVRGTP